MEIEFKLDTAAYLDRIGYRGPIQPTLDTLRRLHLAHLQHVPFENLSIHWHEPVLLEPASLYEKIVARKRGGFCYELNGLFAVLLAQLGFKVSRLTAGVKDSRGDFSPDFDHLALRVDLDGGRYLVDVGFGDSFQFPLCLDANTDQDEPLRKFRLERSEPYFILWEKRVGSDWESRYRFRMTACELDEFTAGCRFHTTSPESPFTQKRICSLLTSRGRVSLSDLHLIETTAAKRTERILSSEAEFTFVLQDRFGITRNGLK